MFSRGGTQLVHSTANAMAKSGQGRSLVLSIPGSTGNLGPGFDCMGLALAIYCRLTFTMLDQPDPTSPLITLAGAIAQSSEPDDTGNLVYKILRELWKDKRDKLERIRIHVDSDIPLGCGLGSSAAAILGALWADHVFDDRVPTTGSLLSQATTLVGHSETLAASLMGKCVITAPSISSDKIVARRLEWPSNWATLFVVPRTRLKTDAARSVLPKSVSHKDAVWNSQRVALLVSAITTCDDNVLKEAMDDRLHESYREHMVPELNSLRRALVNEPILGCVLSGAGPSVMVVVNQKYKENVYAQMKHWASSQQEVPSVVEISVDQDGIKEL